MHQKYFVSIAELESGFYYLVPTEMRSDWQRFVGSLLEDEVPVPDYAIPVGDLANLEDVEFANISGLEQCNESED